MLEFEYVSPETIDAAVDALGASEARALAGGTDLVPQLPEGRRHATRLVDLKRIPELTAIEALPDGGISIGAAATLTAVSRHTVIANSYPAVAQSAASSRGPKRRSVCSIRVPLKRPPGPSVSSSSIWRRQDSAEEQGRSRFLPGAAGSRTAISASASSS